MLSGDDRRTRVDGNASEHVQALVDNLTFDLGDDVLVDGQATERADKVVFELTPQCGSPLTFVWSRRRQRDDTGEPVTTRFTEGTLRQIAAATGGEYVRSTTGDELRRAIAGIVGGERRFVGWRTSTERRDLYPALLAVAAMAGAALWVLL